MKKIDGVKKEISKALKHLPNFLSIMRIPLAVAAIVVGFFLRRGEGINFAVYWTVIGILIFSFITDNVDGRIARHFGISTKLGATFDIIGDYSNFISVCIFVFFQLKVFDNQPLTFIIIDLAALGLTIAFKVVVLTVTKVKFGYYYSMHTYFNKGSTFFIAVAAAYIITKPLWGDMGKADAAFFVLFLAACLAVAVAYAEELALVVYDKKHGNEYNIDRKGFLFDKKGYSEKTDGNEKV